MRTPQGHRQLNRVHTAIQQLLVTFITYEFELDHVIPSLLGYVIIVPILTVLPGPSFRSTIFDDELTLR